MRGWGLKLQVGRTTFTVGAFPWFWDWRMSMMAPREFGLGFWVTKDWQ